MYETIGSIFGSQNKLTDWENEPTLQSLRCDYEASIYSHDVQVARIDHWNNLLKVEGSVKIPKVKGRSSVQPKLIRRQAEWRYSALSEPFLSSDKLFTVNPVSFEDTEGAKQSELILNWQFRTKMNRVKFIDEYVKSAVDDGTCIVRVGWVRATKKVMVDAPVYEHTPVTSQSQIDVLQQAVQIYEQDPTQLPPELLIAVQYLQETGTPTVVTHVGSKKVETEVILENRPTTQIINPRNFYIDPSCNGDIDNALFVVHTFETNKAELQKQGIYRNLDRVSWDTTSINSNTDHTSNTPLDYNFKDIARKKSIAYEYWGYFDVHGKGELTAIVATWIGDTLIRLEENPMPDGKLPFVIVPYLPMVREAFGEPDAETLEDNQKILGAVSRGMIDLLGRSANGQQGFAKGMLDPLNKRKYDNGLDYEFNPNINPLNGIIEHKYPSIPESAMLMLNLQNQEAEAITGVKSFSGGMSGNTYGNVAAGIRGMLDASTKREMSILRRLAKGISDIGSKIVNMNTQFLSEQEVVRVTNSEFVTINRDDLAGNYDLQVDISTAEIDNAKAQDLGFMLQTIGPNMGQELSMTILSEIATLKRMPALAEKLKSWQPQPNPMQEQLQQLEMQRVQLELERLKSEIMLNQAKAQSQGASAQSTMLDTQKNVSGMKHKENIETAQAQAKANQNLEITKAMVKPRKVGETSPNIEGAIGFNHLMGQQPI